MSGSNRKAHQVDEQSTSDPTPKFFNTRIT